MARSLRILLIDDDRAVLMSMLELMQHDGHDIVGMMDAEAAIAAFAASQRAEPFAIVFTDLHMPNMDGYGLAEKVKQLSPDTRVVLLTGDDTGAAGKRAATRNVDHVLGKPFRLLEFRAVVNRCLGG